MEIFKKLEYRGFTFEVSNYGNVKYLSGLKNRRQQKNSSGYSCFTKGSKMFLIHRMVAIAFIENPMNKKFVNHKDGNKQNNHVDNLEWVTQSENELHSVRVLGNKRNLDGFRKNWANPKQSISINSYLPNGVFYMTFKSGVECAKHLNTTPTNVSRALKNNGTCKSYKLKHANEA